MTTPTRTEFHPRASAAFESTAKDFTPLGWHLRNKLKVQRDLVKAWLDDPRTIATCDALAAVTRLEKFHAGIQAILGEDT